MNNLSLYLKSQAQTLHAALDNLLPPATERPARLHEAMRYSMFAGGKRLRPALCIAACEACGGKQETARPAACALELLHTYTLIHDDLPAMDDDTLRRGQPTCHVAFDEATAVLAGDALLTLAFEVLASVPDNGSALALELARASGSRGVIGGQAEDLAAEGQTADEDLVDYIHNHKTAALIRAACVMGGLCANTDEDKLKALATYGEKIGLAFQITDDLLDETATVEELGKDIGSDRARSKMTYPAVHGTERAKRRAEELIQEAKQSLQRLPGDTSILKELAEFVATRNG
jgi:geranylgeranyl diphosphate synthase type II